MRARNLSAIVGATFVILGILGFAVGGFSGFVDRSGVILIFFRLNPLQSVIHVVIGMTLLRAAAAGEIRSAALSGGFLLVALGVLGFVVPADLNLLALNRAVDILHLAGGVALLGAAQMGAERKTS
ncbi:MAG: DUF4383 domain-containing protein [Acidimicrobiia bacterium]